MTSQKAKAASSRVEEPMELVEFWNSGDEKIDGVGGQTELICHVLGAPNQYIAREFVRTNPRVPIVLPGSNFLRRDIASSQKGPGIVEVRLTYKGIDGKFKIQIDNAAERIKITKSKKTVANYGLRKLVQTTVLLVAPIGDADTTMVVGTPIITAYLLPFLAFIDNEIVLVTGTSDLGFTLTIERGQIDTIAAGHALAAEVTVIPPGKDFGGLINVGKDKVDGVDWYGPGHKLRLQWSTNWATLDPDYSNLVESMGGTINDSDIELIMRGQRRLYRKGELACLGGTFDEDNEANCTITLNFICERNSKGINNGERDGTNGTWRSLIPKRGFQYGWMSTVRARTGRNRTAVETELPDTLHIEEIGDYADFAALGVFGRLQTPAEAPAPLLEFGEGEEPIGGIEAGEGGGEF